MEKRIILDLSIPEGNAVNDGIDKTKYLGRDIILKFSTVDRLAQIMVSLGKGCMLFKRDLKRYYRQIFIDPVDAVKLGYQFQDNLYFDAALPLGMTSSAYIAQRITSALTFVMQEKGVLGVNYIDDIGCASTPSRAEKDFLFTGQLFKDLGILESSSKASPPNTKMVFLGIQLDSVKQTMEIDSQRLSAIKLEISKWMGRKHACLKDVQSLVGSLSFCASCIPEGRLFFSRILSFLKSFQGKGYKKIPTDVRKDLNWWHIFAQSFNMITAIPSLKWCQPNSILSTDACLTGGGGWSQTNYFHFQFTQDIMNKVKYINQLELYTIIIAVRIWKNSLVGLNVLIYCDNETTVQIL